MNGRIIGIKIDGEFVPCETSCDISIDGERIGTSSSENGNWKTSISGYRSWKVGVNGNLTIDASPAGAMKLIQAIIDGQNVMLIMTMRVTNAETFIISGNASPTNISISANSTSTATWSGNFEGNGIIDLDYSSANGNVYFGPYSSFVTAEQIQYLNSILFTTQFTLETGTGNRFFNIAIKSDRSISSVKDLDAGIFSDITSSYQNRGNIEIDGESYTLYGMEIALPYSTNHRHLINLI